MNSERDERDRDEEDWRILVSVVAATLRFRLEATAPGSWFCCKGADNPDYCIAPALRKTYCNSCPAVSKLKQGIPIKFIGDNSGYFQRTPEPSPS